MDEPELIVRTDEAGIAQLILNRPNELNAWTYSLESAFFAALDAAAVDPAVRVVVVTGAGRGFCAGASFSLLGNGSATERPDRARRRRLCELTEFAKPVIAAINGPAAGLGLALALSCDVRFAAAEAKLTTSFARLGLVAEHGVSWLLPRVVGFARANDLLLSGRTLTGTEAAEMGLVNRSVESGACLEEAMAYARMLVATGSPASWATIKRQLLNADRQTLSVAYEEAMILMEPALASADHKEGVRAFREKRSPQFAPLSSKHPV
ncbi:enoyl-CoA hydratase-related protein [Streptosporangium sp. NPDC001681]|uniref:enoyl-CoA hydratase-related protein n=1 Tax=Streptosporangium sp. NPDC001681 TaxID=3154395 RepID=UPI003326ED6E